MALTNAEKCRRWQQRHPEKFQAGVRIYRKARIATWAAKLAELKNYPCVDCHQYFHRCQMQFDHRPGELKLFQLGQGHTRSSVKIEAELAKCDLVCANCHALRTWVRRNYGN